QYSHIFNTATYEIASNAETDCYDVLGQKFGTAMYAYAQSNNNSVNNYPRTHTNFMNIPFGKSFLEKDSQPLLVKVSTPVIIYQGSADSTVPKAATDVLVALANQKQTSVRYITDESNADRKSVV